MSISGPGGCPGHVDQSRARLRARSGVVAVLVHGAASLAPGAAISHDITVTMPADPAGYTAKNCFAVTDPALASRQPRRSVWRPGPLATPGVAACVDVDVLAAAIQPVVHKPMKASAVRARQVRGSHVQRRLRVQTRHHSPQGPVPSADRVARSDQAAAQGLPARNLRHVSVLQADRASEVPAWHHGAVPELQTARGKALPARHRRQVSDLHSDQAPEMPGGHDGRHTRIARRSRTSIARRDVSANTPTASRSSGRSAPRARRAPSRTARRSRSRNARAARPANIPCAFQS